MIGIIMHIPYETDNIFAKIIRREIPSYTIYEDDDTLVILDIMPESYGHTLVITKTPATTLFSLSEQAMNACMRTVQKIAPVLMDVTQADGLQIKQYNGEAAGQTIFQVHFHLVPSYHQQDPKAHARQQADTSELAALAAQLKDKLTA